VPQDRAHNNEDMGPIKYATGEYQLHNKTPWPESASELYRPSHRRLLAKLVPTFSDRGCRVVSVTDP
jgi:hypothetical protein